MMKGSLLAGMAICAFVAAPFAASAQGTPPGLQEGGPPGLQQKGGMPPGLQRQQAQPEAEPQDQQAAQPPAMQDQQQAATTVTSDDEVLKAINNLNAEIKNLQETTQIGNVQVVTLEQTVKGKAEVSNAIDQNASSVQELQATIKNKQEIENALEQQNLSAEDVIAVDVGEGGKVKVYARKEK